MLEVLLKYDDKYQGFANKPWSPLFWLHKSLFFTLSVCGQAGCRKLMKWANYNLFFFIKLYAKFNIQEMSPN